MEGKSSESSLFIFSATGQDKKKSEAAEDTSSTKGGTEAQSSGPEAKSCTTSSATEVDRVTQLMAKSSMHDSFKTVADLISSKLAAILNIIQAIRSHRSKHRLENAQEDHVDNLSLCICNRVYCIEVCDVRQWLPDSKFDPKVSALVYQLEESYLALGEAFKEGQHLDQALKVVKVACLLYDSIPQHLKDKRFSSSCQPSASDGIAARDEARDEQFPHTLFLAKAWWLVGDVYTEYHRKERSTSVIELPIYNQVTEVMEQYKTNLNFSPRTQADSSSDRGSERKSSHTEASTSSGDASTRRKSSRSTKMSKCKSDGNSSETEQLRNDNDVETDTAAADNHPSVVLRCGGIVEFLGGIEFVNSVEDHILAAIACYEAARKAIGVGESSEFLSVAMKKKGLACNELGYHRLENRDFSGAGIAFMDAEMALEEVSDNTTLVQVYSELGLARRTFSEKLVAIMDLHEMELKFPAVRKQYLDLAKSLQLEALKYYKTAKRKLPLPGDDADADSLLHNEVSEGSSKTSQMFEMLLANEKIPNKGQRKHDRSDFSHRRASYKASGFDQAKYKRSGQILEGLHSPETHPAMYLKMLMELSDISLGLSNTFDSNTMKKVALRHLLEGRNITKANGDRKLCRAHHVGKEFWKRLQDLLETMLSGACLVSGDGASNGAKDSKKLEAMQRMSSESPTFSQLHEMHKLWFS